jgi:protein-tyrosine-phosphatase
VRIAQRSTPSSPERRIDILVVCTGNTCRSPMAAALLARHLRERGVAGAHVHSAGTLPWRGAATDESVAAMHERGLDVAHHRSRELSASLIARADLVLGMTRDHVGRVVAIDGDAHDRAFLLGELVRLAAHVGPWTGTPPLREWVASVAAHRPHRRVPGRASDEIADPAGHPVDVYRRTADRLDRLTSAVADLLAGTGPGAVNGERPNP